MSLSGGLTAGLVAGLTSRAMGGASAWNPSRLTGLAATLLPALSRSSGLLWQNTAKTTPATADGDPVRVAVCPFTAVEFTAPSDAARPLLWDEGSGKWSLSFDGVDDGLALASSVVLSDFEVWVAGFRPTNDCILICGPTGLAHPQFRINQTANRLNLTNDEAASAATSSALPTVCPAEMSLGYSRSGTAVAYYQGASAIGTGTLGSTCSVRRVGFAGEFGVTFHGRIRGATLCTAAQTVANRSSLVNYLGAL